MQIRSAIKHSIKPSKPEPARPLGLYLISSFPAASMAFQSLHRLPGSQAKDPCDLFKTRIGLFLSYHQHFITFKFLGNGKSPPGP